MAGASTLVLVTLQARIEDDDRLTESPNGEGDQL
jgi:hypothetical protein